MLHILPQPYKDILGKYFLFYIVLDEDQRLQFEIKVAHFIHTKRFQTAKGLPLSDEVKILTAAVAVKASFGLERYFYPSFNSILIYPDVYFSSITLQFQEGEVHSDGTIVVSWKSILTSLQEPNDNYNVGMHLFTHALYLEHFIGGEPILFGDPREVKLEQEKAMQEITLYRKKFPEYIRARGITRYIDFFSIASETFFEVPLILRARLPRLYTAMSILYNLDMADFYARIDPEIQRKSS